MHEGNNDASMNQQRHLVNFEHVDYKAYEWMRKVETEVTNDSLHICDLLSSSPRLSHVLFWVSITTVIRGHKQYRHVSARYTGA